MSVMRLLEFCGAPVTFAQTRNDGTPLMKKFVRRKEYSISVAFESPNLPRVRGCASLYTTGQGSWFLKPR